MRFLPVRRFPRAALSGLAIALAATCTGLLFGPAQAAERSPVRRAPPAGQVAGPARVIVKFRADAGLARPLSATSGSSVTGEGPQQAQALSRRLGLALTDGRPMAPRIQLVHGQGITSEQLASALAAQADVEYAVVDGRKHALAVTPNDPLFGVQSGSTTPAAGQWYLRSPTSSLLASINVPPAWALTLGSSSVVVADLDTGVRFDHPDLTSKLVAGYDFVGGVASFTSATAADIAAAIAVANDGDARDSDPSDPGDWVTAAEANQSGGVYYHCGAQDSNGNYIGETSSWHGTQTAGLIGAATDNGIGMAGVGRNVMVQPLRVLGKCGGYDSDIIDAMRWAAGISVPTVAPAVNPTPARVVNLSLGATEPCSPAYQDAINELAQRNVVVVVASGNEGLAPDSPANCTGVVSVTGVRHTGTKVGYSNLGAGVTISAPAGNCVNTSGTCLYPILTTSNTGTQGPVAATAGGAIYTDGGGNASLGTSFSTPLVAGTLALMYAIDPQLTAAQAISTLKSSARAFPTTSEGNSLTTCTAPTALQQGECYCTTSTCGAGLLDAGAAVAAAAALVPVVASVSASTSSVVAGTSASFNGSNSTSTLGGLTYQWTITAGNTLASFSSATNAATVTLATSAAGSVTVTLTVTDSVGRTASSSAVLTVTAPAVAAPTPPATSSGGGGGAMSFGWLLAWWAAVLAVRWVMPPRRRRA